MKVTLKEKVESAHQWIGDDGKLQHKVLVGNAGEVWDSETLGVGDAERALTKLVKLGLAA
jgi:hypothetical protein